MIDIWLHRKDRRKKDLEIASIGQYLVFLRQSDRCLSESVANEGVAAGLFTASKVLIIPRLEIHPHPLCIVTPVATS